MRPAQDGALPQPLRQSENGYRYSLDPFLLADFAASGCGRRIIDLGCGVGIIPLLIAARRDDAEITGLEIQAGLAELARHNVAVAGLSTRIGIVHADLRDSRTLFPAQSFDTVLANPPFRVPGSGRIAPHDERAAARHELHGSLEDFMEAARYLLVNGGRLFLVHLPERLAEIVTLLRARRLEPKRLVLVHHRPGTPARLVLIEARRAARPGLQVDAPLFVEEWENCRQESGLTVAAHGHEERAEASA